MPIEYPAHDGVRFIKNIMVPLSDGVQLAMDMHVPEAAVGRNVADWQGAPRGVILEYIPYRKDDSPPYQGMHHYFARHGFIGARIDCRGTGSSEGVNTDEYTPLEQQDGVEAVEWIAAQPWCNGKVAITGSSYGGFTAVQIAAHRPPHLATIIPIYYTDDRYTDDCHYRGGCLRGYYDIGVYGGMMVGFNAMPPYAEFSGGTWAELWEQHLANNMPYLLTWLENQTDGPYWKPGSIRGRYEEIECPVFMIGGWRDGYTNPLLRTFLNLKTPKRLLAGPWNHALPNSAVPGPRIDHWHETVRWCDYWLHGKENGVMDDPALQIYVQSYDEPRANRTLTSGYWRAERDYPFTGAHEQSLYLSDNGSLAGTPPAATASDEYRYRPTVGLSGGLWSAGFPVGLPTDQRTDEAHALCFTTAPLTDPLEIIGNPRVELHVSSTAPVMAFAARLCDVAPDGTSALVCSGILNGTRRDSLTDPAPLVPGEMYALTFELDATAWRFEAGHCLRLAVCSSDFPNVWPTPYHGINTLYRGAAHPSHLVLPTVPTKPIRNELQFAELPAAVAPYSLGPRTPVWETRHDVLSDRVGVIGRTAGKQYPTPGIEVAHEQEFGFWASNRDPGDAVITKHSRSQFGQPAEVILVETNCTLRSTAGALHLAIDLNIEINSVPHYQRRWVRSYERQLL